MAKHTQPAQSFEAGESNARAVRTPETDAPAAGRRSAKPATSSPSTATAEEAGVAPAGTDVVQPPAPRAPRKRAAGKHRK